jgi:hypothetical protein
MPSSASSPEYDVCLSFAGEQRPYVEKVADALLASGLRVFYDGCETASLWGKDLYEHLDSIYSNAARYCVLFVSQNTHRRSGLLMKEEALKPALCEKIQNIYCRPALMILKFLV